MVLREYLIIFPLPLPSLPRNSSSSSPHQTTRYFWQRNLIFLSFFFGLKSVSNNVCDGGGRWQRCQGWHGSGFGKERKMKSYKRRKLAGLLLRNQIFTTLARATKESSYQFFFFFSINSYQLVVNWFGMCNKTLGLWVYLARWCCLPWNQLQVIQTEVSTKLHWKTLPVERYLYW